MSLAQEDVEALGVQGTETLAVWWCQLNDGKWPRELPNPENERQWVECGVINTRRCRIMFWIAEKIGMKECLRVWNAEEMSRKEFEEWWNNGP